MIFDKRETERELRRIQAEILVVFEGCDIAGNAWNVLSDNSNAQQWRAPHIFIILGLGATV